MKKVLFTAALFCGVLSVNADVLYWMVSDDYAETATSASLYATYSGSDSSISSPTGAIDTKDNTQIYAAWDTYGQFETPLGSYAGEGWSYYIEVVNAGKTYTTDPITYANAKTQGFLQATPLDPVSLANGSFGQASTYNVPEPTSGLLFIIGGMLLGLKRKRQV